MRRRLALALLIGVTTVAGGTRAQDPEEKAQAEALFQAGRDLSEEGRHAEACLKFRASQELDPAVGTLLNLADCHVRIGQTASAWGHLRAAAALAHSRGDSTREKVAVDAAASLEPRLSKLAIVVANVDVPSLVVLRDGRPVDRGSFGTPVPVDPGIHVVEASAPGHEPWRTTVAVGEPGSVVTVTIPRARAAPAPGPEPDDTGRTQRILGGALAGAGVAGLVVGGVLGVGASSTWRDAQSRCRPDRAGCTKEGVALGRDAGQQADVATAVFVIGAIGVAAGAVLWLTAPSGRAGTNRARSASRPTPYR